VNPGTTEASAAAEIVAQFNADPKANNFAWASVSGNYVVLSALGEGTDFAFTAVETASKLDAAVTVAAADPAEIPFGRAILIYSVGSANGNPTSLESGGFPSRLGQRECILPTAATHLVAPVITVTVAGTAEDSKKLGITLRDPVTNKSESFWTTTGTSATVTTIAAALKAAINTGVLATSDNAAGVLTITGAETGRTLEVTVHEIDSSTATYTVATVTAGTDVEDLLGGIVAYRPMEHDTNTLGTNATGVKPGEELVFVEEGFCLVPIASVPARNAPVYVGFGTTETGKLFSTSGTNRRLWRRARWTGDGRNGLAAVHVRPLQ
jgi:hypothetical protein